MSQDTVIRTAIAPMLSVWNGARVVEFYQAAFGTTVLYRLDGPALAPLQPGFNPSMRCSSALRRSAMCCRLCWLRCAT